MSGWVDEWMGGGVGEGGMKGVEGVLFDGEGFIYAESGDQFSFGRRSLHHPSTHPPIHPSTHPPIHPSTHPPHSPMFLYLSKLLPLFVYPIGLSCLLLIVALFRLWKHPTQAAICISVALAVLLVAGNGRVATRLVQSLEWQHLPPQELPQAEAIVVLGGAIKPQTPPRPWFDLSEASDRVLHGARLYQAGKAPLIIFSGGHIDWSGQGLKVSESEDMAELAKALDVPASAILEDPTSLNTYENAVNVKAILQERGINRVLLVTSAMHMPRSLKIFQKQGIDAIPAPTDFLVSERELWEVGNSPQSFLLNNLPDAERIQQTTRVMKEYIGIVVYRLRGWL